MPCATPRPARGEDISNLPVDDAQPQLSTLNEYIAVIRRRKWAVLQAVIIVPIVAVALSLAQHKAFQSSAQVYVSNQNFSSNLLHLTDPSLFIPADRWMQTQVDLARSTQIAGQVAKQIPGHGLTAARVLNACSVTELTNADILVLTCKSAQPALSRELASEYASQFTIYGSQLNTAALKAAQAHVQARIAQLVHQGQKAGSLYNTLSSQSALLSSMIALQTANARVIVTPTGAAQVQPKPTRNALIGIALGLILGLGLAFLLEALDSRVRNVEEVSARLPGLPLLARLPRPERKLRSKQQLPLLTDSDAPQAEAFRMLRTQLDLARLEHPAKTIMITSAVAQEGKSTTAANLAMALARAGRRVTLVDLDFYHPMVAGLFSLSGPGVTDVVLGTADLSDALVPIPLTGQQDADQDGAHSNGEVPLFDGSLEVLPAGQIGADSGDFMNTQAVRELLSRLEERADTVIIDTSPLLQAGDAMTLSTKVDGVLLVVRMNLVRRKMLSELARVLERTPATKLGYVLTDAPMETGYGYAYRPGYRRGEKGSARQVTR